MKCKKTCNAKILFGCFNIIFFLCGLLKVACGFLLLCDTQRVLLSRLLVPPEGAWPQPPLYYVALALLAAGLSVCATSALGCWATYMPGYCILTVYFLAVSLVLAGECACGALATLWPRCAAAAPPAPAAAAAAAALRAHYAVPDHEQYTAAVDLAQTQFECCGMTDGKNYDMSVWKLNRLGPRGLAVPLSCCVQDFEYISYLNPQPLNDTRCQDPKPNPQYRHVQGCLSYLEEWYHQQYLIFMMGLFACAIFKFGLLLSTFFSCTWIKKQRRQSQSLMLKTMDNNTNENIYQVKMFPNHDEPITAKYVQPNNFYSPRVRNPRMFPNKPNEVI